MKPTATARPFELTWAHQNLVLVHDQMKGHDYLDGCPCPLAEAWRELEANFRSVNVEPKVRELVDLIDQNCEEWKWLNLRGYTKLVKLTRTIKAELEGATNEK